MIHSNNRATDRMAGDLPSTKTLILPLQASGINIDTISQSMQRSSSPRHPDGVTIQLRVLLHRDIALSKMESWAHRRSLLRGGWLVGQGVHGGDQRDLSDYVQRRGGR